MVPIGEIDIAQRHDALAAGFRLRKGEVHRGRSRLGRLDLLHARDLLQLSLRLAGFARLCTEAISEFLESRNLALLVFECRKLLLLASLTLFEKGIVVTRVREQ